MVRLGATTGNSNSQIAPCPLDIQYKKWMGQAVCTLCHFLREMSFLLAPQEDDARPLQANDPRLQDAFASRTGKTRPLVGGVQIIAATLTVTPAESGALSKILASAGLNGAIAPPRQEEEKGQCQYQCLCQCHHRHRHHRHRHHLGLCSLGPAQWTPRVASRAQTTRRSTGPAKCARSPPEVRNT